MRKFVLLIALIAFVTISCTKESGKPYITLKGDKEYDVPNFGGEVKITFDTNQSTWGYDLGGAEWLKASKGNNLLLLTIPENESSSERTATVKIYVPESNGQASVSVSIWQAKSSVTSNIKFGIESPLSISCKESSVDIPVTTTFDTWEYEEPKDSWYSLKKSDGGLVLSVEQNESAQQRTATLTVYAPNKAYFERKATLDIVQAANDIQYDLEDLSSSASSNCYVISHRGEFCFNALVRGNGATTEGLDAPKSLAPASAKLLWQSAKNMISKVSYSDGKIYFTAGSVVGNALIAATNSAGKVIWSWHIWFPKEEITGLQSQSGEIVMNMNLGATSSTFGELSAYGLLYQWGRKDPFPGSPIPSGGTIMTLNVPVYDIDNNEVEIKASSMYSLDNNTLEYSIANPTECLSNNNQYYSCRDWLIPAESNMALWGNPNGDVRTEGEYTNLGSKSFYDPCPIGWRVPPVRTFRNFTGSAQYAWVNTSDGDVVYEDDGNLDVNYFFGDDYFDVADSNGDGLITMSDYKNGWMFYLDRDNGVSSYFPATTRYDGQYALLMGSMVGLWGNYWFNCPSLSKDSETGEYSDSYLGQCVSFSTKDYSKNVMVTVSPLASGSRADAYAVRCVKE